MVARYERYAQLRDERGLTDYQVGKMTGISQSTFPNWKAERYVPKAGKLLALAVFFEVPVTAFMEETNESKMSEARS